MKTKTSRQIHPEQREGLVEIDGMGLHLLQSSTGRFSFVGRVPMALAQKAWEKYEDAVAAANADNWFVHSVSFRQGKV